MAEKPVTQTNQITGRRTDAVTRRRLLAILQEELARASDEALADGLAPDVLTAQLDERIARLRAQLAEL